MKNGIANCRMFGTAAMTIVAITTAMSFANMLPPCEREILPSARASSGGPGLGNREGVAIDRFDVENFAALAGDCARDARVPQRVAIFYARLAGVLVQPGIESGRLAEIEARHALGPARLLVPMHPYHAGHSDRRRGERLPGEHGARVGQARAGKAATPSMSR